MRKREWRMKMDTERVSLIPRHEEERIRKRGKDCVKERE